MKKPTVERRGGAGALRLPFWGWSIRATGKRKALRWSHRPFLFPKKPTVERSRGRQRARERKGSKSKTSRANMRDDSYKASAAGARNDDFEIALRVPEL